MCVCVFENMRYTPFLCTWMMCPGFEIPFKSIQIYRQLYYFFGFFHALIWSDQHSHAVLVMLLDDRHRRRSAAAAGRQRVLWHQSLEADAVVSELQLLVQRRIHLGGRCARLGHAGRRLQALLAPVVAIRLGGGGRRHGGDLEFMVLVCLIFFLNRSGPESSWEL